MHKLLTFNNEKLLRRALTHRSYINEHPEEGNNHNERLEFLGDALLTFICAEYLHDHENLPEIGEDEMTRRRAALVDEKQLAKFAQEVGIDFRMRLGTGAMREGGFSNPNLLSSTFEAVVAAYYIDNGRDINKVRECIIELFDSVPGQRIEARSSVDAKNRFQTIVQAEGHLAPPHYKTQRIGGLDHAPEFEAIVYVKGNEYGRGRGNSKKEAEKRAAEDALLNWQKKREF